MDEQRKSIIVKEIEYWKKTNLLPETYCNYLLTLYTEGDREQTKRKQKQSLIGKGLLVLPFICIILFVVIMIATSIITVQLVTGLILIIAITWLALKVKMTKPFLASLYSFIGALFLYLLTIQVIMTFFQADSRYILAMTLIHSLSWLMIGLKWRIHFFTIGSVLAVIAIIIII